MNPLIGASLLNLGGGLLGGLGGLLSGPSESQKRSRQAFSLAQSQLGRDIINPQQFLGAYQQSLVPQFNRQAEQVNRRLGLDSGLAQGELARSQQSTLAGLLARLQQANAFGKANRDTSLLQLMLSAARGS